MSLGVHAVLLERAEHDQPLVGEAAGDGDDLGRAGRATVLHRPVLLHDHGAAVAVAEVDDLDRHALRPQGDGHRRDHERRLHLVGDQRFLDLGEALEHPRDEDVPGLREAEM